jgi:transposase
MYELPDLSTLTSEQKDDLIRALYLLVQKLEGRMTELEDRLLKDSRNSSKPPSSDTPFKKTKSLRKASGRKPGGQQGHLGITLKRVDDPDEIVIHSLSAVCDACGLRLDLAGARESDDRRQVFELPPLRAQVTEHRVLELRCRCGKAHRSQFPTGVNHVVQYGASIKSAGVYLMEQQLLPVARAAEVLFDLCGISISAATLQDSKAQAVRLLAPAVSRIADAITQAATAHFDETGLRVNKKLNWMHVASTKLLTWYGVHDKRGQVAMDAFGILPRFKGTAIHDGLKSYRRYDCTHGLCNSHHLRELEYLVQTLPQQTWPQAMIALLCAAKRDADEARDNHLHALDAGRVKYYRSQYETLLTQGEAENPTIAHDKIKRGRVKQSTATNLLRRLREYADDVLRFTTDLRVPFDNNQAERDIRMQKLKQKIAGCFRTTAGAQDFCTVRSYFSTLRKQGRNIFDALRHAFQGQSPDPLHST